MQWLEIKVKNLHVILSKDCFNSGGCLFQWLVTMAYSEFSIAGYFKANIELITSSSSVTKVQLDCNF